MVQKSRPSSASRRGEILAAATAVFGAKGFHSTTLQEIAAQVGVTHPAILHHFGSKEKLLQAVLEHRDETDVQDLPGQQMPGGVELFEHLISTADANERRAGIVAAFAVLSAESVRPEHPAHEYFVERYEGLRQHIIAALPAVVANGKITADDAARASASIIAVMDGLQLQWLLDPSAVSLAETTAFAIDAIIASLATP